MTNFVDVARRNGPLFEQEAEAGAAGGALTPVVRKTLRESGLLSMHVPSDVGGGGVGGVEYVLTIEEVARHDPSAAWVLTTLADATAIACSFMDAPGHQKLFVERPSLPVVAGLWAPSGTVVKTGDRYRITGRYQFGSGIDLATHIVATGRIVENGEPVLNAAGEPVVRSFFVPRDKVEFLGGWNVTGLQATASWDYSVDDVEVDYELSTEFLAEVPFRGDPIFGLGLRNAGSIGHGALALGITKRALEEVVRCTSGKRRQGYSVPISEFPVFLDQFARAEAKYQSAKGYLLKIVDDVEANEPGSLASAEQKARIRQAVNHAHDIAHEVVSFAHLWGSTQAVRRPTVLGKITADLDVATVHLMVDPSVYSTVAPALIESWRTES